MKCTKFGGRHSLDQYLLLHDFFLDFKCVAVFEKMGDSKRTRVENRGKVLHLFTPAKISGGIGEISESVFHA